MKYLLPNQPSVMYLFSIDVLGKNQEKATESIIPLIKRCEDFADSIQIHCHAEHFGFFDKKLSIKVTFQIQEPQNSIFMKVPALFSFIATTELLMINQFFYPE